MCWLDIISFIQFYELKISNRYLELHKSKDNVINKLFFFFPGTYEKTKTQASFGRQMVLYRLFMLWIESYK